DSSGARDASHRMVFHMTLSVFVFECQYNSHINTDWWCVGVAPSAGFGPTRRDSGVQTAGKGGANAPDPRYLLFGSEEPGDTPVTCGFKCRWQCWRRGVRRGVR